MQYNSLYLYDANGNQLWYDDYNEWNGTVGFRNDVYDLDLIAGTYYLKVTGYRSSTNYASTGTYVLKNSFTSANAIEVESNNSVAEAQSITLKKKITGQIAINDQYDFYTFTLSKDRTVKVDVTSYMKYYSLYLYDVNGNQLWYDDYNEWNSTIGQRTDTYYLDLSEGVYYLKVTGYRYSTNYASTGTYTLVLDHVDAPVVKAANVKSTGKVKLTWDSVDEAVKYKVYRATSKTGTYTLKATVSSSSYTDTSAVAGKKYYYKVVAVASNGATSQSSNIVTRTCDCAQPKVTLSNVASSGKVKVTWKSITGAKKYEVYRATSKNGTYKLVKTTTSTSWTDTTSKAGKIYYYKVKAINSNEAANSVLSTAANRTCDLARPTISVKLTSAGKPRITWGAVSGATKYKVYRSTSKNGTYTWLTTTTKTYYTNTSAKAGKTYYYKVVAVHSNTAANSAYSSVKYIKSTK